MRQVSGSAVQGLDGAALRPVRVPGPRGFNLLSQLILTRGRERSRDKKGLRSPNYNVEEKKTAEGKVRGGRGGVGRAAMMSLFLVKCPLWGVFFFFFSGNESCPPFRPCHPV